MVHKTIEWRDGLVRMLDQRALPQQIIYQEYTHHGEVARAIQTMVIRGAPAIGAAAAYGLALAAYHSQAGETEALRAELKQAASLLNAARPTAANLKWALGRVMERLDDPDAVSTQAIKELILAEAQAIAEEDVQINRQMGKNALPLIPQQATIIHHCNTGALATVDYGTALGVIRCAHEHGRRVQVLVDETRPRLQGARLTAWELEQLGIPYTLIVDSASGYFMRHAGVDLCLVGCDRIAANGDTANKIGTYNLALVAYAHHIPFYVVGPTSTIDMSLLDGEQINIEQRDPDEVLVIYNQRIAPEKTQAANPAFDVTPAQYITAIITEAGIAYPPYTESLPKLMRSARFKSEHPDAEHPDAGHLDANAML
jgi:methylthioribose-1-phosphate isomerase